MKFAGMLIGIGVLGSLYGCSKDGLVGGDCAPGYEAEGDACVPILPDQGAGAVGSGGATSGTAAGGQGGDQGGAGGQGAASTGSRGGGGTASTGGTGGSSTGGTGGSSTGGTGGGATGTGGAGGGAASGSGGVGGGFVCDEPLTQCGGTCVDLSSDELNCGACGVSCATDICFAGTCTGNIVGHFVVLGMNYKTAQPGTPAAALLGNSVFLSAHEPLRVLDYREHALESGPIIDDVIEDEAIGRGRTVQWSLGTLAADVPAALDSGTHDVLLVHDEVDMAPGALGTMGSSWAPSIDTFAKLGGIVVIMATAAAGNEMPDFLSMSGVLQTDALTSISGQTLENIGWLDAVGQNVLSPFLAKNATASITTSEVPSSTTSFVIIDGLGTPVVVHKVVVGN